ncbi:MAG: hypothetical protein WC584_05060, partial [Candidatus Pacearchaeota archaeon]
KVYVTDTGASNGGYLKLLYKDFNAGNVIVPKKNSKSNYIIFVVKSSGEMAISNLIPSSYQIKTLQSGSKYYVDRIYTITSNLPSSLNGHKAVITRNDFLSQTSFNANKNVRVYLAWDMRENIPTGWTSMSDKVYVTDTGASNGGYLKLLYKDFNAGNVIVPKKNSKSNYIIFVIKR